MLCDLGFGHTFKFLKARSPNQANLIQSSHHVAQNVHGGLGLGGNFIKSFTALKQQDQLHHLRNHRHLLFGKHGRVAKHHKCLSIFFHAQRLKIADLRAV